MTEISSREETIVVEDVDEQPPTRRPLGERAAAAAAVAWRGLVDAFSVFDWITAVGTVLLLGGLWVWFGAGPALAAVGALVVWMGIAGGRAAAAADPEPETPADDAAEE